MSELYIECKIINNCEEKTTFENFVYDLENVYHEDSMYLDDRKLYKEFEGFSFHTKVGIITGNMENTIDNFCELTKNELTNDDNLMYFNTEEGNNWWKLKRSKCCEFINCNIFIYDESHGQKLPDNFLNIRNKHEIEGNDLSKHKILFLNTKCCYPFFCVYSSNVFKRIIVLNPELMNVTSYFEKIKTNFLWLVTNNIESVLKTLPYKKILPHQENFLEILHFKND